MKVEVCSEVVVRGLVARGRVRETAKLPSRCAAVSREDVSGRISGRDGEEWYIIIVVRGEKDRRKVQ